MQELIQLAAEDRYRLLVEAITDYAIYMLDPSGIVSSWNPGAQRFKGYGADEIIGKHFSRFYTDEDKAVGLPSRALEAARTTGKFEAEGWRVRKDGTRFWAFVIIDSIRGPAGEILGYAKITRDLTERRKAEADLRRSEEQFRLLVQAVTDYAIYFLSPQGNITSWNLGAERIKGYAPNEIIGRHFSQFYTRDDRETGEPEKALATATKEGRFEKEGWRLRKDGTRFLAHVIIDIVRDEAGEHIGFAKITRDITERAKAQEKLEKTREAFFQSQKQEAIGQITGGVAHDFNNLLMAVLGSLELMRKRRPDDERLRKMLENAVEGTKRGATLTKRMLAFAGRQELNIRPVDVPELVRGMSDLLESSLGPSVRLETRFPLIIRPVMADTNQLEMALLNLCVNARDAMAANGEIVVAAREAEISADHASGLAAGLYVCLTVTDNGIGMDERTLARATEPFFTTKEPGKGTGLGLSMVYGLAEQSGGQFRLSSRFGAGTTAELWFPAGERESQVTQAKLPEGETFGKGGLRVVAVDDDVLILITTVAMLEDLGHTAFAASSAKEALEILRRETDIDLVITDQAMPRMTGAQLAEVVRSEWPDIFIILATGYAELQAVAGMQLRQLSKPFTEAELARELTRIPRGNLAVRSIGSLNKA
jgi:PAS domain S-box-containing protein